MENSGDTETYGVINDWLGISKERVDEANTCASAHCIGSDQSQLIVDESER